MWLSTIAPCKYRMEALQSRLKIAQLEQTIASLERKNTSLERSNALLTDALVNKMDVLMNNSAWQRQALEESIAVNRPRVGLPPRSEFEFAPLDTEEQLDTLEPKLEADQEYRNHLQEYLLRQVFSANVDNRLHLVFSKSLFAQFSWTSASRSTELKLQLSRYTNILELFRIIGGNETIVPTAKYVAEFLKRKLKYAKQRIHISAAKLLFRKRVK
uniref:DUF4806 domain-containing protein n=1 Tax=Anopheles culicifacies TaxID=139723 RepID=A0A182M662_9DIPT